MTSSKPGKPKPTKLDAETLTPDEQRRQFIEAAREAGASEDEAEFDAATKKIAKAKPPRPTGSDLASHTDLRQGILVLYGLNCCDSDLYLSNLPDGAMRRSSAHFGSSRDDASTTGQKLIP